MLTSVIILVSSGSLTGKHTNGVDFLISHLNLINLEVERLLIIKETDVELEQELSTLAKKYDILLIVGELNTNMIFKTLGNICCTEIKLNKLLKPKSRNDDLAMLPPSAKLLTNDNLPYPVIYLQRIFVLKEEFVEVQFLNVLKSHLEQYATQTVFKKIMKVQMNGNSKTVTDNLNKLVNVETQNQDSVTTLTVTSQFFESIVKCEELLKNELHENFLESSHIIYFLGKIYESNDECILNSLKVIEECISTYGCDNIFLSFNGGKDCTVLLHLVCIVLQAKYPHFKKPLFCLYVKSQEAFTEQDNFISQCQIFYNLNVKVVTSSIKEALADVLSSNLHLKACFMGTRRTDPYSVDLKTFQMTDPDWPQVMRVCPLLDWHYSDIWDYLLFYKVPYCKLYDLGYTSIGSTSNTIRNPSLYYYDVKQGKEMYLPAYKLINECEERSGRNIRGK